MTRFKTLFVGAAVGALLAVFGVAAAMTVLDTTAAEVATKMANQANADGVGGKAAADPIEPPTFYGAR